ncbi:MAG: hypothetical protein WB615_00400, partial [Candidatus Tumulicola sp.]
SPIAAVPVDPPRATAPAPGKLSLQRVRAAWQSVRSKVESEHQPLRGPLSGVTVAEVNGDVIVLVARNDVDAAIVRERIGLIEAAAADVLGSSLNVAVRTDGVQRPKGAAPGGAASVTAGGSDPGDPDALFNYASERIRER